jgi:hypothetical protein
MAALACNVEVDARTFHLPQAAAEALAEDVPGFADVVALLKGDVSTAMAAVAQHATWAPDALQHMADWMDVRTFTGILLAGCSFADAAAKLASGDVSAALTAGVEEVAAFPLAKAAGDIAASYDAVIGGAGVAAGGFIGSAPSAAAMSRFADIVAAASTASSASAQAGKTKLRKLPAGSMLSALLDDEEMQRAFSGAEAASSEATELDHASFAPVRALLGKSPYYALKDRVTKKESKGGPTSKEMRIKQKIAAAKMREQTSVAGTAKDAEQIFAGAAGEAVSTSSKAGEIKWENTVTKLKEAVVTGQESLEHHVTEARSLSPKEALAHLKRTFKPVRKPQEPPVPAAAKGGGGKKGKQAKSTIPAKRKEFAAWNKQRVELNLRHVVECLRVETLAWKEAVASIGEELKSLYDNGVEAMPELMAKAQRAQLRAQASRNYTTTGAAVAEEGAGDGAGDGSDEAGEKDVVASAGNGMVRLAVESEEYAEQERQLALLKQSEADPAKLVELETNFLLAKEGKLAGHIYSAVWQAFRDFGGPNAVAAWPHLFAGLVWCLRVLGLEEAVEALMAALDPTMAEVVAEDADVAAALATRPRDLSRTELADDSRMPWLCRPSLPRFQLLFAGETLPRPHGVHDEQGRVPFAPDEWQHKLLDIVDGGNSALVIAPTSAGKTFISYYVMKRVMSAGNNGVVLVVVPTEALVDQFVAEVTARYSKKYPDTTQMVGVFTQKQERNVEKCQVLVTVPHAADGLMTSIAYQDVMRRVQWVVADEVHNIIEEPAWERMLLMCNTPFLALSATVGNPDKFAVWLASIERKRGRQLYLVNHNERWNDLAVKVWDDKTGYTARINPAGSLDAEELARFGLPNGTELVPEDALQLFVVMSQALEAAVEAQGASASDELKAVAARVSKEMNPDTFAGFPARWNITLREAHKYGIALLQTLSVVCKADLAVGKSILDALNVDVHPVYTALADTMSAMPTREYLQREIMPFLLALRKADRLPVLLFHLHAGGCEKFMRALTNMLAEAERETRIKEGFYEEYDRRVSAMAELKKRIEDTKGLLESAKGRDKKAELRLERDQFEGQLRELRNRPTPDEPDSRFCFTWPLSLSEMQDALKAKKMTNEIVNASGRYSAMRRGIAVHHTTVDKAYRRAVESLFRQRRVRVVFATATLSMGINMPCRTVAMFGDSPQLHALAYRQMSGRAGRRGQDQRGDVLFIGLPSGKVQKMVTCTVPAMTGHAPVDAAFLTRLGFLSEHVQAHGRGTATLDQPTIAAGGAKRGAQGRGKGKGKGKDKDAAASSHNEADIILPPDQTRISGGMEALAQLPLQACDAPSLQDHAYGTSTVMPMDPSVASWNSSQLQQQ